jgi:endonuclease YncB( thermonuclease family)
VRAHRLLTVGSILVLASSLTANDSFADAIGCSLLRAQIYDGIPGPGVLVGASTGGCPSEAAATAMDGDANADAGVTFSGSDLEHSHRVDLTSSATTRVLLSEAFLSFQAPADDPILVLSPTFAIEGATYSTILQLETAGRRLTYFTGVPVLAGEATVQADSAGPIPDGAIPLLAGASYTLYSRLATFGDFDQSNTVRFALTIVPEPSTAMLLGVGLLWVSLRERLRVRRRVGRSRRRQRRVFALTILAGPLIAAAAPAGGETFFEGRVVGVIDGDTIDVLVDGQTVRVRLADIDTPERGQPWASRAKQALSERIFNKQVRINEVATDRYGRTVGEVYADNVCVGCELVRDGHAWVYRDYSDDEVLLELEASARKAKRGLWALPETSRMPPWEWRHRKASRSEPRAPEKDSRAYACGEKRTCSEMDGCAEARFYLVECGLTRLDGDGDGVPCESRCPGG